MIFRATASDIAAVAKLGTQFFIEANAPGKFNEQVFEASWSGLLASEVGAIFCVHNDGKITGAIGSACVPDFNTGDLVALEMFWFASALNRSIKNLRLIDRVEEWAREKGAERICMVHLKAINADRLERYYERRGYRPLEVYYWKPLGEGQ